MSTVASETPAPAVAETQPSKSTSMARPMRLCSSFLPVPSRSKSTGKASASKPAVRTPSPATSLPEPQPRRRGRSTKKEAAARKAAEAQDHHQGEEEDEGPKKRKIRGTYGDGDGDVGEPNGSYDESVLRGRSMQESAGVGYGSPTTGRISRVSDDFVQGSSKDKITISKGKRRVV